MIQLKVKKLTPTAKLPTKATSGSAGWDVYVDDFDTVGADESYIAKVKTGLAIEIPDGYELQIRPRSGLSSKGVIAVLGTIDSDYRGEICVLLDGSKIKNQVSIKKGDRIAQFIVHKLPDVEFLEVETLSDTSRGTNGFGSTGK
jgi:dUTP pyrophosphatase